MPIYEYELNDDEPECQMFPGRFGVLQGLGEGPVATCPHCGLGCHRVVSRASIKTRPEATASRAAKHGLTTWKKAGQGQWEKVDGPGVDAIVGQADDTAVVTEKRARRVDLTDA